MVKKDKNAKKRIKHWVLKDKKNYFAEWPGKRLC